MSLPEEDVAVLDEYAHTFGLSSRSAAPQHAIHLLRHADLEQATHRHGTSGSHRALKGCGTPRRPTGSPTQRDEVRLSDLEPARGSGANKGRPAIIVNASSRSEPFNHLGVMLCRRRQSITRRHRSQGSDMARAGQDSLRAEPSRSDREAVGASIPLSAKPLSANACVKARSSGCPGRRELVPPRRKVKFGAGDLEVVAHGGM